MNDYKIERPLEIVILSEVSQKKTDTAYMWNLKKWHK